MADFADRAIAIVSVDVEQDSDPTWAIALEGELLIIHSGQFARAALNGALDVVGGHVFGFRSSNGREQKRIGVGVSAVLSRNRNFLNQASEDLAAIGIERALFVLNCGPF